jgi:hypothetical protein
MLVSQKIIEHRSTFFYEHQINTSIKGRGGKEGWGKGESTAFPVVDQF